MAVRGYVTFTKAREGFEKSRILAAFRSLVDCSDNTCWKLPAELLGLQNKSDKIVFRLVFKGPELGHVDLC